MVFEIEGQILRGIRQEHGGYYSVLLGNEVVKGLLGDQLIETRETDESIEGYALVLEHRKISPINYCYEWPVRMLQDAALLTVEMCIKLSEGGLVVKDATPWNILYEGTKPIFICWINPVGYL